jgi:hypothetical protein
MVFLFSRLGEAAIISFFFWMPRYFKYKMVSEFKHKLTPHTRKCTHTVCKQDLYLYLYPYRHTHTWLRGTQHLGHCRVAMLESAKKTGKKNSGMYLYWAGLRTQTVDRPAVCFGWVATQQKPKPISQSSSVGRVGDLDAFTRKSLCGLLIYISFPRLKKIYFFSSFSISA